jgi:hypothetical protein
LILVRLLLFAVRSIIGYKFVSSGRNFYIFDKSYNNVSKIKKGANV